MKKRKVISLLMLGVLTGSLFLSACGSSDTSDSTSSDSESTDSSSSGTLVSSGDDITIGIPKLTESFDFYNTTNGYESYSMTQVYDSLVEKDEDGQITGSLAESYEVSDDGTVYTFYLHEGVLFSDGTELKASDVVYSMNCAIESAYTSWIYEPLVESCTALDDYTVEIVLVKGSISFLDYLSNINYFAVLSEAAVTEMGDEYGTSVDTIVGTGAYIVTDWKSGEYIDYEANENYFKGEPAIKNIRLKYLSDSSTAMIALQTGEIAAYFDDVPGVSYEDISSASNLEVVDYASTVYFEIIMNCETGIFADAEVRQAVAMAVNRESMMIVGTEGYGEVADYPGDRSGYTEGDPELEDVWYEVDTEAAAAIIEEKGLTGTTVTIKTYADDPYPALATILQDALSTIGFDAEVLQMERSALIDEVMEKGDYEIGIVRWAAGTTDMDEIWYGSLDTDSIGSSGNWSWYSNADLDTILEEAGSETDSDARKALYEEAIAIFLEDVPQIPLYYPNGSRAYNAGLTIADGLVEYNKFFDYSYAE